MTTAVRYGIVGSGWRTGFFLRLARALPERFAATGVVTRTAERGAQVEAQWGVPTFRTTGELVAADRPDFVIVSVPWAAAPAVTVELVEQGVPVLSETPPAPELAGLRELWARVGGSGLVQVAEQYLMMPAHAARWEVLRSGAIGRVTSVQVSSTHLYHAVSMIRRLDRDHGVGRGVHECAADRPRQPWIAPTAESCRSAPRPAGTKT